VFFQYEQVVSLRLSTLARSEVVGRPLAALLANDGARVFSVDIDSNQAWRFLGLTLDALISGTI
jgi:5,10-methylene-tetrahydrofolate dehydrogenase/methenyl tetrahydrofolate cyclohydrolase